MLKFIKQHIRNVCLGCTHKSIKPSTTVMTRYTPTSASGLQDT